MTDLNKLKRARMSLAQAVTRSVNADGLADRQAVEEHRAAAELRLREGGAEHLGYKLNRDLEVETADARANMRQVMQLVDAELEPHFETRREFSTLFETPELATDGGEE